MTFHCIVHIHRAFERKNSISRQIAAIERDLRVLFKADGFVEDERNHLSQSLSSWRPGSEWTIGDPSSDDATALRNEAQSEICESFPDITAELSWRVRNELIDRASKTRLGRALRFCLFDIGTLGGVVALCHNGFDDVREGIANEIYEEMLFPFWLGWHASPNRAYSWLPH